MQSWKIGDVRITRLQEQEPVWPGTMILPNATPDNVKREGEWLQQFTDQNGDHVGWNTTLENGKWVPTFPKAKYLMSHPEWDHWSKFDGVPDFKNAIDDSVRPVVDAKLAELVEPTRRLTNEVWLESTPGHTPGHVSVRISSRGENAVITGDMMHHPIQVAHPDWAVEFDNNPTQAVETRKSFVERYCDQPVTVFGTHFAGPTGGHIARHSGAFRFEA